MYVLRAFLFVSFRCAYVLLIGCRSLLLIAPLLTSWFVCVSVQGIYVGLLVERLVRSHHRSVCRRHRHARCVRITGSRSHSAIQAIIAVGIALELLFTGGSVNSRNVVCHGGTCVCSCMLLPVVFIFLVVRRGKK